MKLWEVKSKGQALYYSLRKAGLNHGQAMAMVIEFCVSASMPKVVAPAKKPARKGKKGGKG